MFHSARKRILSAVFDFQVREVLKTPPMPLVDAPWTVATMVAKRDMVMFILSMKAFYRKLGAGKMLVILDRDTPTESRALLAAHFPGLRTIDLEDIDPGKCQRGGTWERLVQMVRHSQDEYIIQVDCDTLVTGPDIREIKDCIASNTSFAYADGTWGVIRPLAEIAQDAEHIDSDYVGIILERTFKDWPDAGQLKYVRASSGLCGYARGGASFDQLEWFHEQMKTALGARWRQWGTEQSGSNFVVANAPRAMILPYPAYATYPLPDGMDNDTAKFFHFIGARRFQNGYFARHGRRIIKELRDGA